MKVFLGPYEEQVERIKDIEIHNYDTWSMDNTLALIIHPMLVQLKATTHGYPSGLTEQEWDEILDEMIWAFKQKCRDEWLDDYILPEEHRVQLGSPERLDMNIEERIQAHQERMNNGFCLFGKYYENLWD